MTEAVERLPRQAGFSPRVPCGRGGVFLPVAHPEHALCHIAAPAISEHSIFHAAAAHSAAMRSAAMHPFRVPESCTIEGGPDCGIPSSALGRSPGGGRRGRSPLRFGPGHVLCTVDAIRFVASKDMPVDEQVTAK